MTSVAPSVASDRIAVVEGLDNMLEGIADAAATVAAWMASLGDVVLAVAATPWSLVLMVAFTIIDGFFPPIPSESIVITLASLSMTGDGPPLWAILPLAAVGAFVGDLIAFMIGTKVPLRELRVFRGNRGARTLAWAERTLEHRGGAFILAARYIPIGRVVVNMSAGALDFPRRRFILFAGIGAVCWSIYSTLLGIGAGVVLQDRPLLAVGVGIVLGIVLGTVIDAAMRKLFGAPAQASAPAEGPEHERASIVDAA